MIDKPQGITSHDVVDIARKKFRMRRIGHAGTLDPLATGLLIVLVGEATKQFNRFVCFDKEYSASLRFGSATDTGDSQGRVVKSAGYDGLTEEKIVSVLETLTGKIEQIPPMVSALKYRGRPLYQLARKGISVERKARIVDIYTLRLDNFSLPDIEFTLRCSKGTYVRTLGEEIAQRLNCVGHIFKIRRLAVGPYRVSEAKGIDSFNEDDIRPF